MAGCAPPASGVIVSAGVFPAGLRSSTVEFATVVVTSASPAVMAPKSPKAEAVTASAQQRRFRVVGGESLASEITMIRISTAGTLGLSAETRISTRLSTDPAEIVSDMPRQESNLDLRAGPVPIDLAMRSEVAGD